MREINFETYQAVSTIEVEENGTIVQHKLIASLLLITMRNLNNQSIFTGFSDINHLKLSSTNYSQNI